MTYCDSCDTQRWNTIFCTSNEPIKTKTTKQQKEKPCLLHDISVTQPSRELCLSQTSPLQRLPLLVPLALLVERSGRN